MNIITCSHSWSFSMSWEVFLHAFHNTNFVKHYALTGDDTGVGRSLIFHVHQSCRGWMYSTPNSNGLLYSGTCNAVTPRIGNNLTLGYENRSTDLVHCEKKIIFKSVSLSRLRDTEIPRQNLPIPTLLKFNGYLPDVLAFWVYWHYNIYRIVIMGLSLQYFRHYFYCKMTARGVFILEQY